ncbi:MAG: Rnf-Nqr domain containing protein [Acholeplasmataceae bacterium]
MKKIDYKNLVFLSVLPLIFISNTFEKGLFVGFILLITSLIIKGLSYLINKYTSDRFRVYSYLLLTTTILSVFTIILKTFFVFDDLVFIYLSLIILNVNIFNPNEDLKLLDQLLISLSSLLLLIIIGGLREVLGSGQIEFINLGSKTLKLFDSKYGITFLKDASGGFILSGFIFGLFNLIDLDKKENNDDL